MKRAKLHKWIRKSHRYLGVLIGIQFLLWTIGGLYFSWMNLDTVHGTDRLAPAPQLEETFAAASLDSLPESLEGEDLDRIERIDFLVLSSTKAAYRVNFRTNAGERASQLMDAASGQMREPLTEEESRTLAILRYDGDAEVRSSRLIEAASPHDEYRELPLPAYAFTFDDKRRTTIYVAPEHARITSVRNNQWRIFDFLWMLHTMDYEGRDNFNNLLLRAFAVFGLLTISSGFALFIISSKTFRPTGN